MTTPSQHNEGRSMKLIEQAAKAIYDQAPYERDGKPIPWESIGDQALYLNDVRAVLSAIREPSVEIRGWQNMIDAILECAV